MGVEVTRGKAPVNHAIIPEIAWESATARNCKLATPGVGVLVGVADGVGVMVGVRVKVMVGVRVTVGGSVGVLLLKPNARGGMDPLSVSHALVNTVKNMKLINNFFITSPFYLLYSTDPTASSFSDTAVALLPLKI